RGRRRSDANHGSSAGRGFAEVHRAAIAVDARSGLCASWPCRSRLFSLRTGAGRGWSAAGETARCAEYQAIESKRDGGEQGPGDGRLAMMFGTFVWRVRYLGGTDRARTA